MKFSKLIPGVLIYRKNRFIADVQLVGDETIAAYVPTTGRLTGALQPGCRVWLEKAHDPGYFSPIFTVFYPVSTISFAFSPDAFS